MPRRLAPGLSESLVTRELREALDALSPGEWWTEIQRADPTQAPELLARHLHDLALRVLESVKGESDDDERRARVEVANRVVAAWLKAGGTFATEPLIDIQHK